jgi:glyoxylase-like metal-dependent hydrolase (beta-lactamase superfamily II)
MKRWLGIFLLLAAPSLGAAEELFELKPVVEGVYAAIAPGAFDGRCNSAIVLLHDGVLVVDTSSTPSQARALLAQVKKLTDKPVKYVLNTHAHGDHFQGNYGFSEAFPGVEIIASEATHRDLEDRGIARAKRGLFETSQSVEKLKVELAKAPEAQKKGLQEKLQKAQVELAELQALQFALPTLTFERHLTLHDPMRTVEFICLGPAHSASDVVAYLPKEKVIITGDLLHGWVPYMGDSSPYAWLQALEQVEKLDFDTIIGGHGDVMRGKGHFEFWKQYFRDLMSATTEAYTQGATLADARKSVAAKLAAKYASQFPSTFPQEVIGNIEKAYRVVSGQTE